MANSYNRSLQNFVVGLDEPNRTYSPGEIVRGKVYVDLSRSKIVRGLKIRMQCKAKVNFTEKTGSGLDEKITTYSSKEVYFKMEYYKFGQSSGQKFDMAAGSHFYTFEFCLPRNIPSSLEGIHGNVRYTIKAILDRPTKSDHKKSTTFAVVTPFDLSLCQAALIPIIDEENDIICWFPWLHAGVMRVNISVPSSGFATGEAIPVTININNSSTVVDAEKIKLELEQKIYFYTREVSFSEIWKDKYMSAPHTRTITHTEVVHHSERQGPFDKKEEILMDLHVPSVPYSNMIHCSIIDIAYRLKVTVVVSGLHLNIKKKYPITIGTRYGLPDLQTPANSVPTAPFSSDESPVPVGAMPMPMPADTVPIPMPADTVPIPMPADTVPIPMPADTVPIPMPADTMPMPMPTPTAYLPSNGEKIPEKTSNELNPPAPGFSSAITNPDVVPVNTPYPTGNTPYPTGITSTPTSNTPYPTSNTPYPTDNTSNPTNNTPYPTGITSNPTNNTPYPMGITSNPTSNTPYPTGNTPYPTGNTPYPTGNTPYPADNTSNPTGNTPYPTSITSNPTSTSPYPTGNTPYPAGDTPYPTGNTPYPAGDTRYPTDDTPYPAAPPSYDEAVGKSEKH